MCGPRRPEMDARFGGFCEFKDSLSSHFNLVLAYQQQDSLPPHFLHVSCHDVMSDQTDQTSHAFYQKKNNAYCSHLDNTSD